MTKIQKIALFFILIITLLLYIFGIQSNNKKPIEIKPINIETLSIKEEVSPSNSIQEDYEDILSKLKITISTSNDGLVPTKEEIQNEVLHSLKNKIAQQEIKKVPSKQKTIVKKEINTQKKKLVSIKKEAVEHKIIPKIKITRKEIIKKEISNEEIIQEQKSPKISRVKEVALYKKKHASNLEIVNVSENFEIQEEDVLPDAHYFRAIETTIETTKVPTNNIPLAFVEKLGVVTVSDKYESDFTISEKVELAAEGIVNISTASIETQEMKNLEFVNTLGVIDISKDFETTDAKKYLE